MKYYAGEEFRDTSIWEVSQQWTLWWFVHGVGRGNDGVAVAGLDVGRRWNEIVENQNEVE